MSDAAASTKPKKKKKQKKKRDPLKPKRARSAYTFFVAEMRPEIKKREPEMPFAEVGKALGAAWKVCTHKEHYNKLAAADKRRAEREREQYEKNKPKRAISAYMFFVKENRAEIQKRMPQLKFAEIGRLLGQAWRDLPDKSRYEMMAEQDKERAQREKAAQEAGEAIEQRF